jgi:hypothetical protein
MTPSFRLLRPLARGTLAALAGGVLLTNGCTLQHATPYARLQPALYCPGDTLNVGYDIIGGGAGCVPHSGLDCAALAPSVEIVTTSAALPMTTVRGFDGGVDIVPTENRVSASFTPTPRDIFFPTRDVMGRNILGRRLVIPTTLVAQRADGETGETLVHPGMCAGETPVNAPATLPGAPRYSNRLRARRICNANDVPIIVDVVGAAGPGATGMLSSGDCLTVDLPSEGLIANARPLGMVPGMYCGTLQGGGPPPTLRTKVFLDCGN